MSRRVGLRVWIMLSSGSLWGCDTSAATPASSFPPVVVQVGGYTGSDASSGGSAPCNALVDDGPQVVPRALASAPPAPLGGLVSDGRWDFTAYTAYLGASGQLALPLDWVSGVMTIAGSTIQTTNVARSEGFTDNPTLSTMTFSISGTALNVTTTCPEHGVPAGIEYTATASELLLYLPVAASTSGGGPDEPVIVEERYTKQ